LFDYLVLVVVFIVVARKNGGTSAAEASTSKRLGLVLQNPRVGGRTNFVFTVYLSANDTSDPVTPQSNAC
jgi:hypothetical protein